MSEETFRRIADYAAANKIALQFGQIEEPLMHKKIFELLEYAHRVGVPQMHMTTNGTILTRPRADRLVETGINSVMFSIDAATPETFKEIRGANLEELEENVKYFVTKASTNGIKTWASFILQPQSRHEREAFLMKWRSIGVDYVTFYVLTEHDTKNGAYIRTEEHYDKGARYPCASPWMQSVVFPEGQVSLCCKTMTDVGWRGVISMGNLQNKSFEDIWRSKRYTQVRRELLDNQFDDFQVCRECEIWSASTSQTEVTDNYVRTFNETMETYKFLAGGNS
jgi:MoaA/NifB/PqqE/SkfB family radical SAM enzyme